MKVPGGRLAGILVGLLVLALWWALRGPQPLVVYCAHDSVYSEAILRAFTQKTGIPVAMRFDTEATKSLGLVELLIREKAAPRCDLFWNNELLGTMALARENVLLPYRGSGYARMPESVRDPAGCWTGFAGRLRVEILNTQANAPARPEADFSQWAVAKPLYGTTLTHYSVLWQVWGPDKLQAWHRQWRLAGGHELNGNAAVSRAVADGSCSAGFTDTDDFFEAKDAGKPVAMRPVRLESGATICIPNTVAIIRGTRRLQAAQQLADYLLSEETELALARSKSRQIPLGPVSEQALPEEVRPLRDWAKLAFPLSSLGEAHQACLAWLKGEMLR